jgi:hypothetical protein
MENNILQEIKLDRTRRPNGYSPRSAAASSRVSRRRAVAGEGRTGVAVMLTGPGGRPADLEVELGGIEEI